MPQSRVIGGKDVQLGAWPFQAALYYFGIFMCGGVLIAPDWVAGAAHCTTGYDIKDFEIILGKQRQCNGIFQASKAWTVPLHWRFWEKK